MPYQNMPIRATLYPTESMTVGQAIRDGLDVKTYRDARTAGGDDAIIKQPVSLKQPYKATRWSLSVYFPVTPDGRFGGLEGTETVVKEGGRQPLFRLFDYLTSRPVKRELKEPLDGRRFDWRQMVTLHYPGQVDQNHRPVMTNIRAMLYCLPAMRVVDGDLKQAVQDGLRGRSAPLTIPLPGEEPDVRWMLGAGIGGYDPSAGILRDCGLSLKDLEEGPEVFRELPKREARDDWRAQAVEKLAAKLAAGEVTKEDALEELEELAPRGGKLVDYDLAAFEALSPANTMTASDIKMFGRNCGWTRRFT